MNEHTLIYQSIPLNLLIRDYEPISFEFNGHIFYDSYIPPKNSNSSHGEYRLFIKTKELEDTAQLNSISLELYSLAENIQVYLKYITGTAIFITPQSFDIHRKRFISANSSPEGWSSNYDDIEERLDINQYKFKISPLIPSVYAQILKSPLFELKVILENYNSLDSNIKYLMRLNYEADAASDSIRCLVYGKVLEIIDALHPYHGRTDNRIHEFYPDLQSIFGNMTIKKLRELANNRADTRHYVARKGDVKSHPFLTFEELGVYGPLIDNLAINEVRRQFGLEMVLLKGE